MITNHTFKTLKKFTVDALLHFLKLAQQQFAPAGMGTVLKAN